MKVYPVLSILVATALTIVVDAAPTPAHAPRTGIHTDAKAFLLPKYDHKLAEEMNAYYDQAIYGNRTVARSNAVARAASQSVEILPYCAGIAADDKGSTRVQIFKNEMTCDINGWSSLFTFTAYTKKDTHHATYPMCVAIGKSPAYSMFFSNKSPCSSGEWKTEFAFYESGSMTNDPTVSLVHESSVMWHVGVPPQDDALPLLRGKQVWMDLHPEVPLPLFPASSAEMKSLKGWVSYHEPAHADLKVVATPNTMTFRCVQNLIQIWHGIPHGIPFDGTGSTVVYPGSTFHTFVKAAVRDECSDLTNSATIRAGRFSISGRVTVIEDHGRQQGPRRHALVNRPMDGERGCILQHQERLAGELENCQAGRRWKLRCSQKQYHCKDCKRLCCHWAG